MSTPEEDEQHAAKLRAEALKLSAKAKELSEKAEQKRAQEKAVGTPVQPPSRKPEPPFEKKTWQAWENCESKDAKKDEAE